MGVEQNNAVMIVKAFEVNVTDHNQKKPDLLFHNFSHLQFLYHSMSAQG